jgi:chemotaxis protein CheY-P-specific phosphatase CheC
LFSTENPLSINDELFEIKFDIYPNPANQYLNISTNSEVISLSVTNLLGQEIYFQTKNLNFINLSDFSNGIYILKASLEKDYFITRKFIVNK